MKKTLMLLGIFFITLGISFAQEQENENLNAPEITFEKTTHDFGTIENGGDGTYEFVFTNTGKEPLIITNAKGSCGCTVPIWPKQPIPQKGSDVIKVKYDTKRTGKFQKSVTISSNAKKSTTTIFIKGEVSPPSQDVTVPKKKTSVVTPVAKPQ